MITTSQTGAFAQANASPSKSFFVRMLTRDIELTDALLDLLDNCVDGILRSGKSGDSAKPYEGYWAKIEIGEGFFRITDNCGGIPVKIAEEYAFALGRPGDIQRDEAKATVGMYGIGMKRAIFKLGSDATVRSWNDKPFRVSISPEWMAEPTWNALPMFAVPEGEMHEQGTSIEVQNLHPEIASSFDKSGWRESFRVTVAQHYALIIAKGFNVAIGTPHEIARNEGWVPAQDFQLLDTSPEAPEGPYITPYIYKGEIDGVTVEIFAGLYRKLPDHEEAELEEETRGAADDAGWTIACNDRIVVWKDKSRLTGWGDGTVPNFHGQFIAVTGLVLLRSVDKNKLPLTTTKRGLDAGSLVYLGAKELMKEATKSLTSFTNKWKKFPTDLDRIYQGANYLNVTQLKHRADSIPMKESRRVPTIRKFEPTYPTPLQEKTSARVSFVAEKRDIRLLGSELLDNVSAKPNEVGLAAFNHALARAKSK